VVALGVGVGTPAASASTHQHNCGEDHTAAASPQVRAVLAEISCTVADLRPIPALRDSSSTHLTCAPCHSGTLVWAGGSADCKLLVVIDQFEQLVTQTEDVTRELFVRALKPALGKKVQVVGTLRPEFLTTVLHDDNLSELDFNLYPIAPLKKAALIEIIRKPAERADIDIPSALAATMARDTMGASKSGEVLPLLAFTLAELTSDRAPGEKGFKVTARAYKDFGGIHGAIAKKADEALNDIRTQRVASADDTVETLVKLVQVRAAGPTKNLVDEMSSTTRINGSLGSSGRDTSSHANRSSRAPTGRKRNSFTPSCMRLSLTDGKYCATRSRSRKSARPSPPWSTRTRKSGLNVARTKPDSIPATNWPRRCMISG
jgi:hypothetical protein